MSSSLPEGVAARAATRAEAASAADIMRMSQEALIGRSRMAVPDLLDWWARVDLEHNSWLLEERDRLIAFGWLDPHGGIAGAGEFYRRGDRRAGLGVDSDNPTGATRLYERAGMRVEGEFVVRERELA